MTMPQKPFRNAVLVGRTCRLVPFVESMVCDDYVRWLNTPDVNRFLEVRRALQSRDSAARFVLAAYADPLRYFWGVKVGKRLVGTATLYRTPERHSGEVGLMIGEREVWGTGVADELIDLIAQFAFGHLKIRRLTGGTYANNMSSNFLLKKLGFVREGVLRKCRQIEDGSFVDEFLWGVLAEEWRIRYPLQLDEAQS